jgi:rubrerythrin
MEISERELQHMTAEVRDLHEDGMKTMTSDIAELHEGEGREYVEAGHRNLAKGLGMGGAALAIGAAAIPLTSLFSSAYASTDANIAIAKFAESVEFAAVAAYQAAAKTGLVTGAGLSTALEFAKQHEAHGLAFLSYAGGPKLPANPKLVAAIAPEIEKAKTETEIVTIAYGVENAAAATYLYAIGALTSDKALALTATILPVESQHATVWGQVLGYSLSKPGFIPAFLTTSGYLSPTTYPTPS